jgi:hypothetical protein
VFSWMMHHPLIAKIDAEDEKGAWETCNSLFLIAQNLQPKPIRHTRLECFGQSIWNATLYSKGLIEIGINLLIVYHIQLIAKAAGYSFGFRNK